MPSARAEALTLYTRNLQQFPVTNKHMGEAHSLWLMPRGEVCERLSMIIAQLSARHDAPEFPPHVTLLGGCVGQRSELISQCAGVAATLRPFTIRLEELDFREEYFRCLFVHAALTAPLRHAHQAACQAFHRFREPAFMPHLSLLYGDFPRSLKERIIAAMGRRIDVQFKVRALHLYRTHGAPRHWRRVATLALK